MAGLLGAVIGTVLCVAAAGPAAKKTASAVALEHGEAGAQLLVEAMRAPPRPSMSDDDTVRFEAVLVAVQADGGRGLGQAWRAFAGPYFDPKTKAHAHAIDLIVLAAAVDKHAPELAKKARVAARFAQRRDRLGLYVAAVKQALAEAKRTGKPVALDLGALPGGERPDPKPMTADELAERLVVATKNMQEMNMSFRAQLGQLAAFIEQDRSYAELSNIMKTKSDAKTNSVRNVRD